MRDLAPIGGILSFVSETADELRLSMAWGKSDVEWLRSTHRV